MRNKYVAEVLWFCLPLLMTIVFLKFDISEESTVDINVHDSYFVIKNIDILYTGAIFLGFIIMLIRVIISGFKNNLRNVNFLIYASAFILLWAWFISLNDMLNTQASWTVHPPLSRMPNKIEYKPFFIDSSYLYFILGTIVLLTIFTGYKTGLNITKKPK
ncbi:hypothetical protein KJK34_01085 [Flavobacterium sp. D11R37]|uniref:hypothetical protein n=1 Tax=Flavobacterium coralii TaxID=2838017 RepID=UPI001CA7B4F7|nr:hypothetical protein [Flavobacterium coralii]MBY8961338.1 hypothetical protein [Flavobacterium coralii]